LLSHKELTMKKWQCLSTVIFLCLALGVGWAQGDSGQQSAGSAQQPADNAAPAPAFGQDNPPPQSGDNPPLSGLDTPSLEPHAAARSYLVPGLHISESLDSNVGGTSGNTAIHGVTRAFGSLMLQRIWRRYETFLDYSGGAAIYTGFNRTLNQIHQLDGEQRILWRTGQLALRDSFSYLPEGSFGYGSFGGAGAYQSGVGGTGGTGGGIGGGAVGGIFGPGQFGSLGQQPRIINSAVVDMTESLTPRSSFTLAGGYGLVHFMGSNPAGFINSRQASAQAGYNYQLNRKDQLALAYGFQDFHYPTVARSSFLTHMTHVLYGHRISGRMSLLLGGGPQLTMINSPLLGSTRRLSVSGRASLRYRFPRASVALSYDRFNTNGSGFFLGASSDVVRFAVSRPLGRLWDVNADTGYSRNSHLLPGVAAVAAQSYQYIYAGGSAHRQLGRYFGLFFSYQFNQIEFDSSSCTTAPCGSASQRHVATVGLDWHPRPIRLD
jgi:hypothetical protein